MTPTSYLIEYLADTVLPTCIKVLNTHLCPWAGMDPEFLNRGAQMREGT